MRKKILYITKSKTKINFKFKFVLIKHILVKKK